MSNNEVTKKDHMDAAQIQNMSYTDFVGFVNQWNVPPGSYVTLNKWITFGCVNKDSRVLEVACTTGFSVCSLAQLTGCTGYGIDVSDKSIEAAKENRKLLCPDANVDFEVISGYDFMPKDGLYTHIVIGAALRFFPDSDKLIKHLVKNCLAPGGKILSCEFYAVDNVPKQAVEIAKRTFDITPTTVPFKEVMKPYKGLELHYQDNLPIFLETEEEIEHYTQSTIDRVVADGRIMVGDDSAFQAAYDRLVDVKQASNELRKYQHYATLVHSFNPLVYPNRYTELF